MSYNFSVDGYDDPGPQVLDHGLPILPAELEPWHGTVVARWVDGDFGVVMVVFRDESQNSTQDNDEYNYDVCSYLRVNGEWQSTNGGGGSGWHNPPFERPQNLTRFAVSVEHGHQQSGGDAPTVRVLNGIAGEGVVSIEVQTEGRTVSMPIESSIGAWVVGVVGDAPARWLARDGNGRVAASGELETIKKVEFGLPSWVQEQLSEAGHIQTETSEDGSISSAVWMAAEDGSSAELDAWFEARSNSGRIADEQYIESERVPDWPRLARDLLATTGRKLDIHAYVSTMMSNAIDYEVWLDDELHSSHGRYFDESDPEGFLVEFTDLLCEQVLHEEIWGGWPTCPVHKTHPLDPDTNESGIAAWTCPKGAASVEMGRLTDLLNS